MRDSISKTRLQELHPAVRQQFQDFIEECENTLDITLRIMEPVFRSIQAQNDLYAQGRTKPGNKITNAVGGTSFHNYGLAIDVCKMAGKEMDWNYDNANLKPIAVRRGIEWGGDWKTSKDKPHFQITLGYTWQKLQALPKDSKGYPIFNK